MPEVAVGLARSCEVLPEWSEGGCHFSAGKWDYRGWGCPHVAVFVSITTASAPASASMSTAMLASVAASALAPALAKVHAFATALPLAPASAIVYVLGFASI